MMEPNSIKEEIEKLIGLQQVDTQILILKRFIEEKPREISELERVLEEGKIGLKTLEDKFKDLHLKRKEKENELGTKEENIKKLQTQLYSLKTNKEYQAMLTEIGNQKADCSLIEESIIKNLDEVDGINTRIKEERESLSGKEQKIGEQKKQIDNEVKDAQAQLKDLEQKRDLLAQKVEKKLLKNYNRILESRNGLAIAEVKNSACQGCFMNMPPQVINEIKLAKNIVTCEMCNRILYLRAEE